MGHFGARRGSSVCTYATHKYASMAYLRAWRGWGMICIRESASTSCLSWLSTLFESWKSQCMTSFLTGLNINCLNMPTIRLDNTLHEGWHISCFCNLIDTTWLGEELGSQTPHFDLSTSGQGLMRLAWD